MDKITIDAHVHVWNRINGEVNGLIPVTPQHNGLVRVGEQEFIGMPAYMLDCSV